MIQKTEMVKGKMYRIEAGIEGGPAFSVAGRYRGTKTVSGIRYRVVSNVVMMNFVEDEYITDVQEVRPMM